MSKSFVLSKFRMKMNDEWTMQITCRMAAAMIIDNKQPRVSGWRYESGYSSNTDEYVYPLRVLDVEKSRLAFTLHFTETDLEPVCQNIYSGYTIYLHTPGGEILSETFVHKSYSNGVNIRIKPTLTVTSEGSRKYPPKIRQCYFASERRLRFFKYYTLHNCEAECLANFTRHYCGCVKFSMPSKVKRWTINYASIPKKLQIHN